MGIAGIMPDADVAAAAADDEMRRKLRSLRTYLPNETLQVYQFAVLLADVVPAGLARSGDVEDFMAYAAASLDAFRAAATYMTRDPFPNPLKHACWSSWHACDRNIPDIARVVFSLDRTPTYQCRMMPRNRRREAA